MNLFQLKKYKYITITNTKYLERKRDDFILTEETKQIQEEMRELSEQYFNEDPDKNTIHENWNKLKSKINDLREKYVPSKMTDTTSKISQENCISHAITNV